MKKMDYQNVRGTVDYLPEEELVRRRIRGVLEEVFVQYGCLPLETPVLNYTDLMASKYGGGAEILDEMYRLTDRGERDLALRYDLTIPFAKVIGLNPGVSFPFKRYEIGKVFRDGPIKRGRLREFTQCDVDVVGVSSQAAEAELMVMALDAFDKLGLDVVIEYNNRKLLAGILQLFGVLEEETSDVLLSLDKLEKIGVSGVIEELAVKGFSKELINDLRGFMLAASQVDLAYFKEFAGENELVKAGLSELAELNDYLEYVGASKNCTFNPFLARGLEIYTGTIYEVFLKEGPIKSSVGSGGRFDDAIGGLINTEKSYPSVGISFGLDVIFEAMKEREVQEDREDAADFYLIPLQTEKEAMKLAMELRRQGYVVLQELSGRKVGRALKEANKLGVKKVIVLGKNEVRANQYVVRDMASGEEVKHSFTF